MRYAVPESFGQSLPGGSLQKGKLCCVCVLVEASKASNLCYVAIHFTRRVFSRFNVDDTFTQPFG